MCALHVHANHTGDGCAPLGGAARGARPERSDATDASSPPPPLPPLLLPSPPAELVAAPNITATSAGASGRTRAEADGRHAGGLTAAPWSLPAEAPAAPCPPPHGMAGGAPPPWLPHCGAAPPCAWPPDCGALLSPPRPPPDPPPVPAGGAGLSDDASGAGAGAASASAGAGGAAGGAAGGGAAGGSSTSASSAHTGSAAPSVDDTVMKRAAIIRVQLIGWFRRDTVSSTAVHIGLPPAYTDSSAVVRAARTSIFAPARTTRVSAAALHLQR